MRPFAHPVSRGIGVASWLRHPRFILAVKTAVAVGIAWLVAPLMPGVANDYPYYAPLGALVSMSPTLMSSAKKGLQTLASLGIGIVLAGAVIVFWEPNVLTISLVVGAGMLIAASRWLTAGGEYVPVAALFVLIIGGPHADAYSFGYLVQMSVGMAVGLLVNVAVFPPLGLTAAVLRLTEFRALLAKHLDEMATALGENWPPEHEEWASRGRLLADTAEGVRGAVSHADESRKGNPRARLHHRDLENDYLDLAELETITFHVRDLTEVLAASVWGGRVSAELPVEFLPPLSETLRAVAAVFSARNDGEDITDAVDQAEQALSVSMDRLNEARHGDDSDLSTAAAVVMNLRRILAIMRSTRDEVVA
jgi:uncharacterized membrane protein YccC